MSDVYPHLSWYNVSIAALFLLINAAISIRLRLKLEKQLVIAALRCLVQLTIMGLLLRDIFETRRFYYVMGLTVLMLFLSACETVYSKASWRYTGYFSTAFLSTVCSTLLVGVLGCQYAVQQRPFWYPEYFIPTIGLLLGFTSGACAVAVDYILYRFRMHMDLVETYLAMGATRWEAVHRMAKDAIRLSLLPTINQMSITGLITLPGTMAGQIMLGVSIQHTILYQQIITFMISASTCFGVVSVVMFCLYTIVDPQHRIRPERIERARTNMIQDAVRHISAAIDACKPAHTRSSKREECQPLL
ncbi:hypothetical protein BC940DRAFT_287986 [Gongronella butleri]|nr:hypothetical protein BC940DRAFT_287986 [Gongronella butleri]